MEKVGKFRIFRILKKFVFRITYEPMYRFWSFLGMISVLTRRCAAKVFEIILQPVFEKTGFFNFWNGLIFEL